MSPIFQPNPDNLYKLMAIHKALMLAKWADPPLEPALASIPYIGEALTEIRQVIDQIEIARGRPESAIWSGGKIITGSPRWEATIRLAVPSPISEHSRNYWLNATDDERETLARIYISPFETDEEQIRLFIDEVMRRFKAE